MVADENIEDHEGAGGEGLGPDDMMSPKDKRNQSEIKSNMANTMHMSFGNESPDADERKLHKSKKSASAIGSVAEEEQK